MMNLNYQMNHILYHVFKIVLSTFKTKHNENNDHPSKRIYINKIENRIAFKIKKGYDR